MQSSANINVAEMLIRYFLMFSPKVEKNLKKKTNRINGKIAIFIFAYAHWMSKKINLCTTTLTTTTTKNTYIQSHKQKIYEQKVDMLVATVQR